MIKESNALRITKNEKLVLYLKNNIYTKTEVNNLLNGKVDNLAVGNISNIRCITQGTTVRIKWKDPEDVTIDDQIISTWQKTVLIRKLGSYPTSVNDGTKILESSIRDQYNTTNYIDMIPTEAVYYYQLFPYSTDNVINNNEANRFETSSLNWNSIHDLVESGEASSIFSVGDTLTSHHEIYGDIEWEIVAFDQAELVDTTKNHSMTLLSKKPLIQSQFDAVEKTYALTDDIVFHSEYQLSYTANEGTSFDYYNIEDKNQTGYNRTWVLLNGTKKIIYNTTNNRWEIINISNNNLISYQTTSTANPYDVESVWNLANLIINSCKKYYTFDGVSTYTEATVVDGEEILADTYYEINPNILRTQYGYNNWKESGIRQWLNSSLSSGQLWIPQNIWDNPSINQYNPGLNQYNPGFINGFDEVDFIDNVALVKNITARNIICDCGGFDITEDKFFLPSQTEIFGTKTNNIDEGEQFTSFIGLGDVDRIKYYNNSPHYWWMRSPYVGDSFSMYYILPTGVLNYSYAYAHLGLVPACTII